MQLREMEQKPSPVQGEAQTQNTTPQKLQQLQKPAINPQIPTRRVSSSLQFCSQLLSSPSAGSGCTFTWGFSNLQN